MKRPLLLAIMVIVLFVCLPGAMPCRAEENPYIDAAYTAGIDGSVFNVVVELSNIKTDTIFVRFTNETARVKNLAARVNNLYAVGGSGETLDSSITGEGLYAIKTNGDSRLVLSYDFNPQVNSDDHHLTTLTSSYLHIPGEDFFFSIYDSESEAAGNGDSICREYKIRFAGLPWNWKILSTYPQAGDGYFLVDSREMLIGAGNYTLKEFDIGGCKYTLAFDNECEFNGDDIMKDVTDIIRYYTDRYGGTPVSEELIVVNQSREKFNENSFSLGGQAKSSNIIMKLGGINEKNQKKHDKDIAGFFAHEIFHIWFARAFNISEEWSWFWEGCAEYQSFRVLYKLGMISKEEFNKHIIGQYHSYENNKLKGTANVIEASTRVFDDNEEYSSLVYDKGAVLAWLYDKKLSGMGKDFDAFLGDMYKELALPGKPVGHREIIDFMSGYAGDTSFTERYIRGTEALPVAPLSDFGLIYYWQYVVEFVNSHRAPPFPLNYLIPLIIISIPVYIILRKRLKRRRQS